MEKEISRAADEADLVSCSVSYSEMTAQNGFFSPLDVIASSIVCWGSFA